MLKTKLEDGALKVFINTKGKNREDFSQEFLDFKEYIGKTTDETAGNTDGGRIKRIHEKVKQIRRSEKAGLRLMQKWEELAYEREEGRAERKEKILKKWHLTAAHAKSMEEFIEQSYMESDEAI